MRKKMLILTILSMLTIFVMGCSEDSKPETKVDVNNNEEIAVKGILKLKTIIEESPEREVEKIEDCLVLDCNMEIVELTTAKVEEAEAMFPWTEGEDYVLNLYEYMGNELMFNFSYLDGELIGAMGIDWNTKETVYYSEKIGDEWNLTIKDVPMPTCYREPKITGVLENKYTDIDLEMLGIKEDDVIGSVVGKEIPITKDMVEFLRKEGSLKVGDSLNAYQVGNSKYIYHIEDISGRIDSLDSNDLFVNIYSVKSRDCLFRWYLEGGESTTPPEEWNKDFPFPSRVRLLENLDINLSECNTKL